MKTLKKLLTLVLITVIVLSNSGTVQAKTHVSPQAAKKNINQKATLAYEITGLKNSGAKTAAIQNFYIDGKNLYITQRKNSTTYLSRCAITGKKAVYKDQMVLKNFGHGETLECYTWNKKTYFLIGCKSEMQTEYNWSHQIARIEYKKGTSISDYTNAYRFTNLNAANKTAKSMGTLNRVAAAVSSTTDKSTAKVIFRVQFTNGTIQYSTYELSYLNSLLDAQEKKVNTKKTTSKYVALNTSSTAKKCLTSFTQSKSKIVSPNNSFQGMELSSAGNIYLAGGPTGNQVTPKIGRMTSAGVYETECTITNVKKYEIEGLQIKSDQIYFNIIDSTKKAQGIQYIYSIPTKIFSSKK